MSIGSNEPKPDYILGLDLGHSQDYTALAILERHRKPIERANGTRQETECHFKLRHLKRWPLKTPYPEIVVQTAPLSNPLLAVDQTGVGVAIVDMFVAARVK